MLSYLCCFTYCTKIYCSQVLRVCVSTGRCGHPFLLFPTHRHNFCAKVTFWLKERKTRAYQPTSEVWCWHMLLRGSKARGLGWWTGTTPGAPQELSHVLLQTDHAMSEKSLRPPLTFSSLLILFDHKLVSWCWPQLHPEPKVLTDCKDKLFGVGLERMRMSWTVSSSSHLLLSWKAVASFHMCPWTAWSSVLLSDSLGICM